MWKALVMMRRLHLFASCTLTYFPWPTDERDIGPNHKFYSHLSDEDLEEEDEEVCLVT